MINEYFIHVDGQPVMVVQEQHNGEGEVEVRDVTNGQTLFLVDSFDDTYSTVIEFFNGLSSHSYGRPGSRLLVALQVATERKDKLIYN